MFDVTRVRWIRPVGILVLLGAGLAPGCAIVPRERLEESRRLAESLRTENARLKDEVLGLKAQNQDFADRALDDLRRLTARDEAVERLQRSVQAYQDDRDRLDSAYRRLAVGLGRTTQDSSVESTAEWKKPGTAPRPSTVAEPPGGRRAEDVTGKDDGDGGGVRSRPPASGSGP